MATVTATKLWHHAIIVLSVHAMGLSATEMDSIISAEKALISSETNVQNGKEVDVAIATGLLLNMSGSTVISHNFSLELDVKEIHRCQLYNKTGE